MIGRPADKNCALLVPEPAVPDAQEKANILVVDDNEGNLLALEAILGGLNQNLIKAGSGREALKHLLRRDAAVILLDVKMPGIDGFETAALIRDRERSRHTPIIFITGANLQESHVFKGYSLGAVDYILKPFSPEILCSKIAVFVDLFQKAEKIKRQTQLLQKSNQVLRDAQDKLETRVRERTSELMRINADLTREIAIRKRVEEELALQARDLTRSNNELEQFAYVISHDLREPLRMVTSYAQLLEKRYKDRMDDDATRFIHYMVDGTVRMKELISDLLEYARIHSQTVSAAPVDYGAVLRRALENLKLAIREKGAEISADPLPTLSGDEPQLTILFQNLIGNGIKFNASARPAVHVSARREAGEWVFSFRDNGIGIEPQYKRRIFEIFQRLHTREEYEGTGIGLAVCKKIVERNGGRIWMESAPGKGSTFFFALPEDGPE